jgi:hypothetical protein
VPRRRPDLIVPGRLLLKLRHHVVYLLLFEDIPLYVGRSRHGLARPFQATHEQFWGLGKRHQLYVWTLATEQEAETLERELIQSLQPVRNGAGSGIAPGWEQCPGFNGPHEHDCRICGAPIPCDDRGCDRPILKGGPCATCEAVPPVSQ